MRADIDQGMMGRVAMVIIKICMSDESNSGPKDVSAAFSTAVIVVVVGAAVVVALVAEEESAADMIEVKKRQR